MRHSSIALLLACSGAAIASPLHKRAYDYALKEEHFVPRGWQAVANAPAGHLLDLEIGLKQDRFDELERHLYEVSDPDHHRYGQHLDIEEIHELVKPSNEALDLVHEWLEDHGVSAHSINYSPAKDWVRITLPVVHVERLLDTKYSIFEHQDGDHLVRTPRWSLPQHLHPHIDTVQPTNSFFRPLAKRRQFRTVRPMGELLHSYSRLSSLPAPPSYPTNPTVDQVCNSSNVTPLCLRTLYGTVDYKPQVPGKNRVGMTNYLGETANRSDVGLFLQRYRPDAFAANAANTFRIQIVNGGDDQQTPNTPEQLADGKDLEGNLDAETILGISHPTPLTAWNTGGEPPFIPDASTPDNTNEPYLVWQQYVLAQRSLPQVVSNSYGDSEQTVPRSYAERVCKGFAQLGARGVSVFFASGDSGVGEAEFCFTNDGKNSSTFQSEFPTGCPYITSVGATQKFNPEIVAVDERNGFVSGGGFARYFDRPAYQESTVGPYVKRLGDRFKGLYNPKGRAYPDISAQGEHFAVIWNGTLVHLDGTSASTPAASAVFSLVNDALLAAGRPPLGFLNPWLYKRGYRALNDVLSGSALGCNTTGFPAERGWDPVSGFGTPNFPKIRKDVLRRKRRGV